MQKWRFACCVMVGGYTISIINSVLYIYTVRNKVNIGTSTKKIDFGHHNFYCNLHDHVRPKKTSTMNSLMQIFGSFHQKNEYKRP